MAQIKFVLRLLLWLITFIGVEALVFCSRSCTSSWHRCELYLCATPKSYASNEMERRSAQAERRQQSLDVGNDPLLSLNLNLDALARARAPERAQELYQRISALHKEGYYSVAPDIVSFNSVLKAWQTDPEKALEFWEAEAVPGRMNIVSYNTFLLALARAGMYKQAESLLLQMQANNAPVRPDLLSYNTVLLAYATAMCDDDSDVGHRADSLIRQMINGVLVDVNSQETNDKDDRLALPSVLDTDYRPPNPDVFSFNIVISTWSEHPNSNEGAKRSEYWLQVMQNDCGVNPDVYTYSIVMKALSRCRGKHVVSRVLSLLRQMEIEGNENVRPNQFTFAIAIKALCNNQQMDEAYKLLDIMLKSPNLQPDTATFTTLCSGWARYADACTKSNNVENSSRAVIAVQKLLLLMKELSMTNPEASPDERTYTSIIKTFGASQHMYAGNLTRQLLSDMWKSKTPPTTFHYNAALDCFAKSSSPTKVIDAAVLWKEMIQAGLKPTTITYNSIIYAAANLVWNSRNVKLDSMQIGLDAFDVLQLDIDCTPTSYTYKFYFKMLHRLLHPKSKNKMELYKRAFYLCCDQGCFNEAIFERIVKATTLEEAKMLFGKTFDYSHTFQVFPSDWSRNCWKDIPSPEKYQTI